MSQFKFNVANAQYPLDSFATVTVASNVGYRVGEKVTAGSVTADVSRLVGSTRVVVKHVKGGTTMTGNLVGADSTTTSATSAFEWGQPKTRDVDGTPTELMFGVVSVDDRGILNKPRSDEHAEVSVSCRQGLSKMQNTDTSVAPTLTYTIPVDGTYGDADIMAFTIASNEALSVAGTPRIAIVTIGSAETVYATYVPAKSTSMNLVFEYEVDEAATSAGQIVSVAYNANGAVITDIGGTAVVPNLGAPSVTGILIA